MFHWGMTKSSGCPGSPKPGVRGRRVHGLALSLLLLASLLGAASIVAGPPASAATNVNVFVAYADNLRASGFFPTPWKGAPNTLFIGNGPSFEAGAIRLDNPTGVPLAVDSVRADLQPPGPVFKLCDSSTVTSRVLDAGGSPLPNVGVDFKILSGPNAGVTGTATTDANGNATFTYKGTALGKDSVQASVTNASGGGFSSNTGTITWDVLPVLPILGALLPGQAPSPTPTLFVPSVEPTQLAPAPPVTGANMTGLLWVAVGLMLSGVVVLTGARWRKN